MTSSLNYYGLPERCGKFVATIMANGGVITGIVDDGYGDAWVSIKFDGGFEAVRDHYKEEGNIVVVKE